MRIEIRYLALITDEDENPINDDHVLAAIDGMEDKQANISQWLDSTFEDLGVGGGGVKIQADLDKKVAYSIVSYFIDSTLSKKQLQQLVEETTDQLTDGYGEEPWSINITGKPLDISLVDLFSGAKTPLSISTFEEPSLRKRIGRSPIFSAIEKGDLEKAKRYLDKSHIFSTDKWGFTP